MTRSNKATNAFVCVSVYVGTKFGRRCDDVTNGFINAIGHGCSVMPGRCLVPCCGDDAGDRECDGGRQQCTRGICDDQFMRIVAIWE